MNPPCSTPLTEYQSGIRPTSSRRPAGHHPPQSIPYFSAASSAARSTPVCPPEIIFTCFPVAAGMSLAFSSGQPTRLPLQKTSTLRRQNNLSPYLLAQLDRTPNVD